MGIGSAFILAALSYATFVSAEDAEKSGVSGAQQGRDFLGGAQKVSDGESSDDDDDFIDDLNSEDEENYEARNKK